MMGNEEKGDEGMRGRGDKGKEEGELVSIFEIFPNH